MAPPNPEPFLCNNIALITTIGDLRQLINNLDDELTVMMNDTRHSYPPIMCLEHRDGSTFLEIRKG